MAVIRATCPTCGDVEMHGPDVQVKICNQTRATEYSFRCPVCRAMVNKAASAQAVEALTEVGVQVVHWDLPAELSEPKVGPPINLEDVLSFHLALVDGSAEAELPEIRR